MTSHCPRTEFNARCCRQSTCACTYMRRMARPATCSQLVRGALAKWTRHPGTHSRKRRRTAAERRCTGRPLSHGLAAQLSSAAGRWDHGAEPGDRRVPSRRAHGHTPACCHASRAPSRRHWSAPTCGVRVWRGDHTGEQGMCPRKRKCDVAAHATLIPPAACAPLAHVVLSPRSRWARRHCT